MLRGSLAVPGQVVQVIQQHLVQSAQPDHLGRPVILLQIDVDRIIATPRRVHALAPEPLQVRRDAGRPGRTDQQIAAVLEIEGLQFRVGPGILRIQAQLLIRRKRPQLLGRPAQVQRDAIEKRPVVLQMAGEQGLVIQLQHPFRLGRGKRFIRFPLADGILVESVETGRIDNQQHSLPTPVQHQILPLGTHFPAAMTDGQHRPEMDAAVRIIEHLPFALFIITGIGMPRRITVHRQG